jgi:membrane protein
MGRLVGFEGRFLAGKPPRGPRGRLFRALQSVVLTMRRYREDHAGDRAAALAFATLLSSIPLLLLAFAVLGSLGVDAAHVQEVRSWLFQNLLPETAQDVQELMERSLESLREASAGLGIAGSILLVAAGWKLLATLQRTFGQIGGDVDLRARLQRMISFWIAVVLSPLLAAGSLVLSGTLEALEAQGRIGGSIHETATRALPVLAAWAAVIVLYRYGGGPRTKWRAAVVGATAAALAWEILKIGFALYLRQTLVTMTVLSGLGVVPVFLLWLYLSWVVVLLGAELAAVANDYDAAARRSGVAV